MAGKEDVHKECARIAYEEYRNVFHMVEGGPSNIKTAIEKLPEKFFLRLLPYLATFSFSAVLRCKVI